METELDRTLLEPFDTTYLGQMLPRIHTPILDLPTRGDEVIDLANKIGMPLMPWQAHVISEATKYYPDTMKPAHKTNALLISRQSGKTHLLRMRILAGLFLWDEKLIIATAQNRDIALETFRLVANTIEDHPFLKDQVRSIRVANGQEEITTKTGCRYKIIAPNAGARGLSADLVVIDEARELQNTDAYSAMVYTTQARPRSQIFMASSAGDAFSVVLNRIKEQAQKAISAPDSDKTIGWWEYSAPYGCAFDDVEALKQSVPALGYTIDMETIQARLKDPEPMIRTELLTQWIETLKNPFPEGAWPDSLVEGLELPVGKPTWLAVDVSPDRRHCSLMGAQQMDNDRIGVGLIQTWESTTSVDDFRIAADVSTWARKYSAQVVGFDRYTASGIAARLASAGIPVQDMSGSIFYQACDELLSAMSSGRLAHSGQEELTKHIYSCARKEGADGGWRIIRKDSSGYVSAAVALAMVIHFASKPNQVAGIFSV
jgi:phage terminase large subunit-like protein